MNVPRHPLDLMFRVYKYILPGVRSQLKVWRKKADEIPDPELKSQAIASMTSKQFHCQGGAVYAAANLPQRHVLIPLIVAFQTISDYLDNLCDRSTSLDEQDFRQLHQAMLDAVDPSRPLHEYYAYRRENDDGGYLEHLVKTCQSCICLLPSYAKVQPYVRELVSYYCDLQVYKHVHPKQRERKLLAWWGEHKSKYPHLRWNEFAAATGSTLGVFMLFLAAAEEQLPDMAALDIRNAYFPHVCALHILLDYLIDQEEDIRGGDLNFCSYYDHADMAAERIHWIADQARSGIAALRDTPFHAMIIEGLLALYLSDPKVKEQPEVQTVSKRLMKKSPLTRLFFWVNSVWIRAKGNPRGGERA
jgi:tetraprenyl-beta-curcumene synthase